MRNAVIDFFRNGNVKPKDTLLFYYSGHAVLDDFGDHYLAASALNPFEPDKDGFLFDELTRISNKSISQRIVIILDCCNSGAAMIGKGGDEDAANAGRKALEEKSRVLESGEGRCILAASMAYQKAFENAQKNHSLFTYYLLDGLSGQAVDNDGNITPDSLGKYAYDKIMSLPPKERPMQRPIRKRQQSGEIILASYPQSLKSKEEYRYKSSLNILNERITENIVRDAFRENRKSYPNVSIFEQKTDNPRIEKLLKLASKQGAGEGKPEFLVTFADEKDLIIVVECKADIRKHETKDRDNYKGFAVDGVLLYSSYLSREFDLISIAISGDEKNYRLSHFLQLRQQRYSEFQTNRILPFEDYIKLYKKDPVKIKLDIATLMRYSRKLHNDLRDIAKLTESEKALFVSAALMALRDESFLSSYSKKKQPVNLAKLLISTIDEIVKDAKLPEPKIQNMLHPFTFIKVHPELTKVEDRGKSVHILYDFIKDIETNVNPYVDQYPDYDILGLFFGEFLRYAGGEKKGLGIILTPRHITELFAELVDVKKDDVVFDNCCGTGGFLIAAMKKMIKDAKADNTAINKIKASQLVGIEPRSDMFALACANMILRGDGKANLYWESCFDLVNTIKKNHVCTVGFLNPPYSQKGEGLHELDFIENCLSSLQKDNLCIAIVPISCATMPSNQKHNLLRNHTLEAVMSLPLELFYPVAAVPCIMVFRAKIPHNPRKPSWFGYWRNDGFIKTKDEGRVDKFQRWETIRQRWLDNYFAKREVEGECLLEHVTSYDEWVAEAYMKTDYSQITRDDL